LSIHQQSAAAKYTKILVEQNVLRYNSKVQQQMGASTP
jgi:hypothetical protein